MNRGLNRSSFSISLVEIMRFSDMVIFWEWDKCVCVHEC